MILKESFMVSLCVKLMTISVTSFALNDLTGLVFGTVLA